MPDYKKKSSKDSGFSCLSCQSWVNFKAWGTKNRNHCPFCLWSRHVDNIPGDRKAKCQGLMKPIGLTSKKQGLDKYGQVRQGELMVVHQCINCNKISINRIAGDDNPKIILQIFKESLSLDSKIKDILEKNNIDLLTKKDEGKIKIQLFGKV